MNTKCETISMALRDSFANVMPIIYMIDVIIYWKLG